MKVAVFSPRNYDREFLSAANATRHEIRFFEPRLNEATVSLTAGFGAVCMFVTDRVTLQQRTFAANRWPYFAENATMKRVSEEVGFHLHFDRTAEE
jgi:hypothetical protein